MIAETVRRDTAVRGESVSVLRWAVRTVPRGSLAITSAFGPGSAVLFHLLRNIEPRLPVIFIDTLHHFPETLEHVERVRARYDLDLRVYQPTLSRTEIESRYGARLWERDLELYQWVTKVEPFHRATRALDGWITGRRRDQSVTRADMPVIEEGEQIRINPLANWTRQDVWRFIAEHTLPYNPLHDRGYRSIGDAPLTSPVAPSEHERAGRWRGTTKEECGIHSALPTTHTTRDTTMATKESSITHRGYARPDALVTTGWLAEHLDDPTIRVVESNEDVLLYDTGHIPGAVKLDWHEDLNDPIVRDYLDPEAFAKLLSSKGIGPDTTVVFYGDKNNWWATYALWVFRLFGHDKVKVLDGGRKKWIDEGREIVTEVPSYDPVEYPTPERRDAPVRAFQDEVLDHVREEGQLIDVRSPDEFAGRTLHMPDYPQEGALRGGHIPGAASIPWARAVDPETGEFLDAERLRQIYEGEAGLDPARETIAYCRIGERSSHTWFVLSYLLGHDQVRNYDGSWTEWGNTVRVPIER